MNENILKEAIKKNYTKKWVSYEYCLLTSGNPYLLTGEFDTKKEAKANAYGRMNYTTYDVCMNPNYKKKS